MAHARGGLLPQSRGSDGARDRHQPAGDAAWNGAAELPMDLWCVALLPDSGQRRARPRWLRSDGRFSLAADQAWTVIEPATAARRLQHWLEVHGRNPAVLDRFQLVPVLAPPPSQACSAKGLG